MPVPDPQPSPRKTRNVEVDAAVWAALDREALRGQGEQSPQVQGETSAILDTAARITTDILKRRGVALAAPIVARFHTSREASTGVEVEVTLEDSGQAEVARAAFEERFGKDSPVDVIRVR